MGYSFTLRASQLTQPTHWLFQDTPSIAPGKYHPILDSHNKCFRWRGKGSILEPLHTIPLAPPSPRQFSLKRPVDQFTLPLSYPCTSLQLHYCYSWGVCPNSVVVLDADPPSTAIHPPPSYTCSWCLKTALIITSLEGGFSKYAVTRSKAIS